MTKTPDSTADRTRISPFTRVIGIVVLVFTLLAATRAQEPKKPMEAASPAARVASSGAAAIPTLPRINLFAAAKELGARAASMQTQTIDGNS
jgi:hypothetical protein